MYTSFYGNNNRDSASNIMKSINTMHMATCRLSLVNDNKTLLFTNIADPASCDNTFQCQVIYVDSVESDPVMEDIIVITLIDEGTFTN